jgi:hypothetical protein
LALLFIRIAVATQQNRKDLQQIPKDFQGASITLQVHLTPSNNMKNITYLFAAFALINFSSCSKSGTSPSKKGIAMYPASETLSQNGGASTTFQCTYNSDNNLTKIISDALDYELDIDGHNVTQTSTIYSNLTNLHTTGQVINTYEYSGPSFAAVDIYTTIPAHVTIVTVNKDYVHNTMNTKQGLSLDFQGSKDITQMLTEGNGQHIDFTYDANDNFKTISWTNLTGFQAGSVNASMTVTAVDNKPSPFSAVKGYNVISYPQSDAPDYALAFCKNNPTQILYKQYDNAQETLVTTEQDDFTYSYNAQGYPTSVTVKITHPGTNTTDTKSYTYTYK